MQDLGTARLDGIQGLARVVADLAVGTLVSNGHDGLDHPQHALAVGSVLFRHDGRIAVRTARMNGERARNDKTRREGGFVFAMR